MRIGELIIRFFLVMAIALPVYVLVRFCRIRYKREKVRWGREILLGLYIIYMIALGYVTLAPGPLANVRLQERFNGVPFATIRSFFNNNPERFAVNVFANIFMFSPIGFVLPLLWRRWQKFWKMLLLGVAISFCIEVAQIFLARSVDIDDLILNVMGVVIGYGFYVLIIRLIPQSKRLVYEKEIRH